MGKTTGIAWTDATWNPWQGCTKVSDGCKNCYMYREKTRYGQDPFTVVRSKPHTFNAPLRWNLPERSRIFVCSWSDFYHVDADDWRHEAWELIRSLPQYDFLIPTKRIERFGIEGDGFMIPDNVWLGVSVENQETADKRVPLLMETPAKVKWVSAEPLLGPVFLPYQVDWVVVGGESGSTARPMDIDWARDLREECWVTYTPYFLKQLGGWPDTRHELSDFPEDMRVREFPA
jgi:protein gp37